MTVDRSAPDPLAAFIAAMHRHHHRRLDDNGLKIWKRALRNIPISVLEDLHTEYLRGVQQSEKDMPTVRYFTSAHNERLRAMNDSEREAEEAARLHVPKSDTEHLRGQLMLALTKHLTMPGFSDPATEGYHELNLRILVYVLDQTRQHFGGKLPGREQLPEAFEFAGPLARQLFAEEVADQFTLEPTT